MSQSIRDRIESFVAGFNSNDIDEVMEYFAEGAVYESDKRYEGKDQIRGALEPQFAGKFGKMEFDVHDMLVDEDARKAAIRWVCSHDVNGNHGKAVPLPLKLMATLRFGGRAGWRGVDVLHFDEHGKITGKFSYTNGKPSLSKELGSHGAARHHEDGP